MTGNRISVYVKDTQLFKDIKLLVDFDNITLTELVNNLLREFAQSRQKHLDVLHRQADEQAALKKGE